jgi:drug/metabolite transporter (DMT)-like permease
MLAGGVVLLVVALVAYSPHQLSPAHWSGRSTFGLVYLIVLGSLVGYSAYAWLLANAPLGQVSTYAYVNPVVAIALGAIVLGEPVSLRIVAGAVLILASVGIVLRRESSEEVELAGEAYAGGAGVPSAREAPVLDREQQVQGTRGQQASPPARDRTG